MRTWYLQQMTKCLVATEQAMYCGVTGDEGRNKRQRQKSESLWLLYQRDGILPWKY